MIEIRHLHLIKQIASTGNMTKASQKLFLTQPSLSHQLKEIESRLGTQLFLRVNKTMVLTNAGKKILQAAMEILPKLELVEKEINAHDVNVRELRISTLCYTCYHWLPSIMQKFRTQHSEVEFDIVAEAINNPIEYILKDKIDLAITNQKTQDKGIHFEKLFDDEQVLLVPSDHPLATREFVKPSDFKNENLIIYKELIGSDYFSNQFLLSAGVTPRKITKMQLTEARIELVSAGLGVTVLSRWLVKPFIQKSSSLKLIRLTKKGFHRTWYAASLSQKRENVDIRQFISFLKEQQLGS